MAEQANQSATLEIKFVDGGTEQSGARSPGAQSGAPAGVFSSPPTVPIAGAPTVATSASGVRPPGVAPTSAMAPGTPNPPTTTQPNPTPTGAMSPYFTAAIGAGVPAGATAGNPPSTPQTSSPAAGLIGQPNKFDVAIGKATAGLGAFAAALNIGTGYVRAVSQSQTQNILLSSNPLAHKVAKADEGASLFQSIMSIGGPLVGAIAGGLVGGPAGAIAGGLIGGGTGIAVGAAGKALGNAATAGSKQFLEREEASRLVEENLGRYNGPLAGALARRRVNDIRLDIGDASILGPDLTKLTDAQNAYDTERRKGTQLEKLNIIAEQLKELNQKTEEQKKINKKMLDSMTDEQRRKFEEAERNKPDPLNDLLDGLDVPDDSRPDLDKSIRKQRDGQLMTPLFGG